jgi:hypothetical protein
MNAAHVSFHSFCQPSRPVSWSRQDSRQKPLHGLNEAAWKVHCRLTRTGRNRKVGLNKAGLSLRRSHGSCDQAVRWHPSGVPGHHCRAANLAFEAVDFAARTHGLGAIIDGPAFTTGARKMSLGGKRAGTTSAKPVSRWVISRQQYPRRVRCQNVWGLHKRDVALDRRHAGCCHAHDFWRVVRRR